jgi:hypothetical protein
MKAAIVFPGYALVDILQPCVTFNKLNTYAWYRERILPALQGEPLGLRPFTLADVARAQDEFR